MQDAPRGRARDADRLRQLRKRQPRALGAERLDRRQALGERGEKLLVVNLGERGDGAAPARLFEMRTARS